MGVTIEGLLNVPFSKRSIEDKLRIIREGKPRPFLNKSAVTFRDVDGLMETEHFDPSMYDHIPWLTACEKRECFFCWPCLLFMPPDLWSKTGIFDFVMLIESLPKHEKTPEHAQAELHLQCFAVQNLPTPKPKTDHNQYNKLVHRHRQIFKRLIDSICYVVTKDIPSQKRYVSFRIKTEDCLKALKIIRSHDVQYDNYTDGAIELINASPNVIADLVDAITNIVKLVIKNEAQSSTYVSLILSEHSSVPTKPQISTFLRYIKDGKVCEKFAGFTNMSECLCPVNIFMHISKITEEYGIANKLLAQSLDGSSLQSSTLYEVIEMLKANYPFSFFVPCYFHGLQQVLKQNLSELKDCGLFFKNLDTMETYFQSTKQSKEFESFMFGKIPNFKKTKWRVQSEFIKVVNTCRIHFIQFFDSVVLNSKRWNSDDVTKALGFLRFLKNFNNVFLLQVLSKLFEYTETLDAKLKSHTPESAFNIAVVVSVMSDLTRERDEGFDKFWYGALKETESGKEPPNKRIKTENDTEMRYRELFSNIVNRMVYEIKCRFASLDSLQFCRLLNDENGLLILKNLGSLPLSTDCLVKLMETQRPFFDELQIQNEMVVLRSFGNKLSEKNVYGLLEYFSSKDLKLVFKNLNRLAELMLTLPLKPPASESSGCKIEKVRKLSYIPKNIVTSGDASVLCVESDVIEELRKNVLFYDDIINNFYEINQTIELVHKN